MMPWPYSILQVSAILDWPSKVQWGVPRSCIFVSVPCIFILEPNANYQLLLLPTTCTGATMNERATARQTKADRGDSKQSNSATERNSGGQGNEFGASIERRPEEFAGTPAQEQAISASLQTLRGRRETTSRTGKSSTD